MFWCSGEASGEQPEMGHEHPCDLGEDGAFEVFGEAAAPPEPCEGAFDDPSLRQKLEAFDTGGSFDDLDYPRPAILDRVA